MSGPLITARDLCAAYTAGGARTTVLREASFEIEQGAFTALRGASGSGKTTLLSLLGGLERPLSGSLRVGGVELTALSAAALGAYRRVEVGFVFQAFHLLPHLSARENVETALEPLGLRRAERRARSLAALDAVGLSERAERFPQELSGGEQQRVAVARAVVKRPRLLLADEPTGSLDEESAGGVLDLLQRAGTEEGRTLVLVTHDPRLAARADRRLHLAAHRVTPEPTAGAAPGA